MKVTKLQGTSTGLFLRALNSRSNKEF